MSDPFIIRNVRLFIWFRLFFNARFYYPVFTVMFLDFGLELEQFALLNVVWALSIVLLEVPSGALADTLGRRNLLRVTGGLLVVEMGLLCLAAGGLAGLLFPVLILNRVLSGAAEAAASGADEALAYDALQRDGDAGEWPRVLERQMVVQSAGFIVSSTVGAALYDPRVMQAAANLLGLDIEVTRQMTIRFPPALCLVMAVLTLLVTLRMEDTDPPRQSVTGWWRTSVEAGRVTLRAGRWILGVPLALCIIAAGFVFDSSIRMFLTLNSQYFRVIELPEWTFGLIGSALSVMGLVLPGVARRMTERFRPLRNFQVLAGLTLFGMWGLTLRLPYWGLLPVIPLFMVMYLLGFFVSHYLNELTPSRQRATVLSFRGLAFNLAYATVGLLYTGLAASLRRDGMSEDDVFVAALPWFPGYFAVIAVALAGFAAWQMRRRH